jgi:hypothetical protein
MLGYCSWSTNGEHDDARNPFSKRHHRLRKHWQLGYERGQTNYEEERDLILWTKKQDRRKPDMWLKFVDTSVWPPVNHLKSDWPPGKI